MLKGWRRGDEGPACFYSDISEPESESASLSRFAADAEVLDV